MKAKFLLVYTGIVGRVYASRAHCNLPPRSFTPPSYYLLQVKHCSFRFKLNGWRGRTPVIVPIAARAVPLKLFLKICTTFSFTVFLLQTVHVAQYYIAFNALLFKLLIISLYYTKTCQSMISLPRYSRYFYCYPLVDILLSRETGKRVNGCVVMPITMLSTSVSRDLGTDCGTDLAPLCTFFFFVCQYSTAYTYLVALIYSF